MSKKTRRNPTVRISEADRAYAAENGKSIVDGMSTIISEHRDSDCNTNRLLREDRDIWKSLCEDCEKEKTDLAKRIESENAENTRLKKDLADLQEERDGFLSQLASERRENASLGEDLESKIYADNEKSSKIAALESDLIVLKGELSKKKINLISMNKSSSASAKKADGLLAEKNQLELKILERDAIVLERDETIYEAAARLAETTETATTSVALSLERLNLIDKARRRMRWLWFAYVATTSAILASVYYMDNIGLL